MHGLPGGAFLWAPVIIALGRKRRAIAPDLPGWGRSFSAFGGKLPGNGPAELSAWLAAVAQAQGVGRFDLVAHGSSCWAALELLQLDPGRIRRLALISPRFWDKNRRPRPFLSSLFGTAKWSPDSLEQWLDRRSGLSAEARNSFKAEFAALLGSEANRRILPMPPEASIKVRFAEYRRALAAYGGATLLIWGRNDPAAPEARVFELLAAVPGAESYLLENAGYFPTLDQPHVVAGHLAEFLEN